MNVEMRKDRKSQTGAIHAIAAHFTNSNVPVVITMSTGSGKNSKINVIYIDIKGNKSILVQLGISK